MLFLDIKLEQNKASKQKVGPCDKTTLQIYFIFTILNTFVSLIFHTEIQLKYAVVLERKLILLFLVFVVTAAILDIRPDQIL